MQLITSAEKEALPDDPAAAFVHLEGICRARLADILTTAGMDDDTWSPRIEYVTNVSAAAEVYGVDLLHDLDAESDTTESFDRFRRKAMLTATKLELKLRARRGAGTVALAEGPKARLRKHLADLQVAVDGAGLPQAKVLRLNAKLAEFAAEIDKDRSSLARILACVALVAASVSKAEDSVIKLPGTINSILVLVGKEKLYEEESTPAPVALPASVERKALSPPARKPVLSQGNFADDLDDDVPF